MIEYILENRIQLLAIVGSILFLFFIVTLVRKKTIREEYSLLWLFWSLLFITFSTWRNGLDFAANLLGIDYAPAALLLLLIVGIIFILVQFSVVISRLTEQSKTIAQELALLKEKIEREQRR